MRKREQEFRLQADCMSREVLTHELKVRWPRATTAPPLPRGAARSGAGRPPLGRVGGDATGGLPRFWLPLPGEVCPHPG